MGHENRKVLLVSTVRDMLATQGWLLYQTFNKEYIFKNSEGEILAFPQHPSKPQLIYLDEILKRTRILRQEFIELARQDWVISKNPSLDLDIHFDISINPGEANVSDIQKLFSTLSDLNRAACGFGLSFHETTINNIAKGEKSTKTNAVSRIIRFTGNPTPVPPEYESLQRRGFFRSMGVLLSFCKDYIGLEANILKACGDSPLPESKSKVWEGVKRFMKIDRKTASYEQQKAKAQLPESEVIKQLAPAIKGFIKAGGTIQKKGGHLSLDTQQLLYNLRMGCKEYADDAILASLMQKTALDPDEISQIRDVAEVYRKIREEDNLPTPAHKAFQIFRMAYDDNVNMADLAALVQTDPAIASRVLKVANSAFYKSLKPISSVQDAIIRLGLKMIKRISLGLSLIAPNKNGPCLEFNYDLFWSESVARAVVAHNITDIRHSVFKSEEAFTVGLLCQIGRLALATIYPDQYGRILKHIKSHNTAQLIQNERKVFGIDHNELAAEMMADWGLPHIFCTAVRYQDSLDDTQNLVPGSPEFELANLLQWPGKMSIILTHSGVSRTFLESVIHDATQLGLSTNEFDQRFNKITKEWNDMGSILQIKTRIVRPWEEICAQIN
ncbi:MAG: HDOD domain-containing protein [Sedimentisphaerales bacterium]|nr:HDOD domain-containing protein [Sedimentisphaerales bacterium]